MQFFVARLLSIAIITETDACHFWNLHPMNQLIYYKRTANKNKLHQCAVRELMHDPIVV